MVSRCFGVLLVTIFFVTLLPFERVYCFPQDKIAPVVQSGNLTAAQVPEPPQMPVITAQKSEPVSGTVSGNQTTNNETKILQDKKSSENITTTETTPTENSTSKEVKQEITTKSSASSTAKPTENAEELKNAHSGSLTGSGSEKSTETLPPLIAKGPSLTLTVQEDTVKKTKPETGVSESSDAKPTLVNSQATRDINCTTVDGKCSNTIPEKVKTSETEKPTEKPTEKATEKPTEKVTEKPTEKVPEKVTDKVPEVESPKVPAKIPGNAATNFQVNLVALLPILVVLLKFY